MGLKVKLPFETITSVLLNAQLTAGNIYHPAVFIQFSKLI